MNNMIMGKDITIPRMLDNHVRFTAIAIMDNTIRNVYKPKEIFEGKDSNIFNNLKYSNMLSE